LLVPEFEPGFWKRSTGRALAGTTHLHSRGLLAGWFARATYLSFLALPAFLSCLLPFAGFLAFALLCSALLRCVACSGRDTLYEIFVSTVAVWIEDGLLAVLVCSKKFMGNTMDYGNMQEKEQRSPWLAIRFGCCASKEDVVDNGRETLRATGMYCCTCFHPHHHVYFLASFIPLLHASTSLHSLPLPFWPLIVRSPSSYPFC
jgi:hypothetical protein